MTEKYGFVYLWYDRKYKKFYIGRHWGSEYDGYVCSSNSMREAYRRRSQDFKRRVIKRLYTSKEDLIKEEQRYLDMIKSYECGTRYYNKTLKSSTPSTRGYRHSQETIEKIKFGNKGKYISEETKNKLREANKKQFSDPIAREHNRRKALDQWADPNYRKARSEEKKGHKQSAKQIQKRFETKKSRGQTKRVMIDGVEYLSIPDAMKTLNKSRHYITYNDQIDGYHARKARK